MHMRRITTAAFLFGLPMTLVTPLPAQVFVVDAAAGPGSQYTSLSTAILAVPDGSTLLVRAGTYQKAIVDGKGLTILCDPGVLVPTSLDWYLTIQNTSPNQPVHVRGLKPSMVHTAFQVLNAQGPVCIDGDNSVMAMSGIPIYQSPTIDHSAQVIVKRCSIAMVSPTIVTSSQVVFEDCTFLGHDKQYFMPAAFVGPTAALTLTNSRVQLVRCSATGGVGDAANPSQPAIALDWLSQLRLLRSGTFDGGAGTPAIVGPGVVRSDPAIVATPGGTVPTIAPMPSLTTADAPPGGALVATHFTANPAPFVIAVALPGPTAFVPGVLEPIWLDLTTVVGLAAGSGPAPAGQAVQVPVPNVPALRALRFAWQSFEVGAAIIEASNPATTIVR